MANGLPQLNVQYPDIAGAVGRGMQMQNVAMAQKNAKLQHELNVLKLGTAYLRYVDDEESFQDYKKHMQGLGMNPDLLPDSYSSEWKMESMLEGKELIEYKQGKPVTISKLNKDGTISTRKNVKPSVANELIGTGKHDWKLGNRTGTPRKTLEDIEAETEAKERIKAKYKTPPKKSDFTLAYEEAKTADPDLDMLKFRRQWEKPATESDFEKAYKQWSTIPGNKARSMLEFRREWEKPRLSEAELTRMALKGDQEAAAIIGAMQDRKVEVARAQGEAVIDARVGVVDVDGVAQAVVDGRETIENVKNTFGVPVQEAVRARVLELDPEFNFLQPRIKLAAIKSSLMQQQKQRGMMGSFVKNLNKQLGRVDEVIRDVISRVGVRAIDLPYRELNTRFRGSGHEKVLESYLIEISNEIGKLSTGSAASIRELSTDAQERWASVHDPNLSYKELKKILEETQIMGNMRLESTDEEIDETIGMLENIRADRGKAKPKKDEPKKRRFKILKVE